MMELDKIRELREKVREAGSRYHRELDPDVRDGIAKEIFALMNELWTTVALYDEAKFSMSVGFHDFHLVARWNGALRPFVTMSVHDNYDGTSAVVDIPEGLIDQLIAGLTKMKRFYDLFADRQLFLPLQD
jgi:hypothetical protein